MTLICRYKVNIKLAFLNFSVWSQVTSYTFKTKSSLNNLSINTGYKHFIYWISGWHWPSFYKCISSALKISQREWTGNENVTGTENWEGGDTLTSQLRFERLSWVLIQKQIRDEQSFISSWKHSLQEPGLQKLLAFVCYDS